MRNIHFIAVAALAGIILASTTTSANVPDPAGRWAGLDVKQGLSLAFRSRSAVPLGYYDLCVTNHSVCRPRTGRLATTESGAVRLTAALWTQIEGVNASVNRSMRFVNDGKDQWRVGGASGDCEDFALTKKSKLLSAGWPSSALLIALGKTSWGIGHAVLIVRTDRGDVVLDNLAPGIRAWTPSLYRWHTVQSPKDTWTWHRFG